MHRELSVTDVDALLTSEVFGHLAMTDGDQPYIVPLAYVFHENAIYGQTTEGMKINILRRSPRVCFQVQSKTDHWRSVICMGTFEELDFAKLTDAEASIIVEILTMKLSSVQSEVGISVPFSFARKSEGLTVDGKRSTLFRILITEKTGREFVPMNSSEPHRK